MLQLTVAFAALGVIAATPASGVEGDANSKAEAILAAITSASDADVASAKAAELAAIAADSAEAIERFLARERKSTDADRRAALAQFGAEVPDATGRFRTPGRKTAAQKKKEEQLDWLAELLKLPASTPARGDLVADIAAIRALAASRNPDAAKIFLDFAFTEVGLIYRDECGRYLRKMSPYSLPALIVASQDKKKNPSKARYANYQLERVDRQDPGKALAAADPQLKIHILRAFAESQFREAIYATLDHVDHHDPRIRKAAREAWLEYATGKPPKPAPKRKLVMAGGKLTDEEEPLWLNHRELGDIEIRRRLEALTGKAPASSATLTEMTKALFKAYDDKRAAVLHASFDRGLEAAGAKDWEKAVGEFDAILAQDPTYPERTKMVPTYIAWGKELQAKGEWHDASTAFAKAHALDPKGEHAQEALAAHHESRAKMKQQSSEDGSAELARAREITGGDSERKSFSKRQWMLYGGVVWLVAGALLLVLGIRHRRQRTS